MKTPPVGKEVIVFEEFSDIPFIGWYKDGKWHASKEFISVIGDAFIVSDISQDLVYHWVPIPKIEEENTKRAFCHSRINWIRT